jgi:16S rRNA (uracil1498-N3)-methyltransferase
MRSRTLHRFFVAPTQISAGVVRFTPEQAHQIARVLRMRRGDTVVVFDGTGAEHEAELTRVDGRESVARVAASRATTRESGLRLVLLQGVPKGEKMDLIVRGATELGVHRIVPVVCERSVPTGSGRLSRWRQIAREAAEQCGRAMVPPTDEPIGLSAFFERHAGRVLCGITLWEAERARGLKDALRLIGDADSIHLLVGPEGGLVTPEVEAAAGAGFHAASLGRRTLRTETAALVAVGLIQYELGDLARPVDRGADDR